jgi:preprotein translocase subunit YajC
MESYSRMSEMNSLVTELAKAGVVIDQDDFVEYIRSGKRPTKFLDKDTGKPVDPDSEKQKDAQHAFEVDDQIKNRPAPSMPNETLMLEDSKDDFVEYVTVPTNTSEEEQALRKAYSDYLSNDPAVDFTYEEFVTLSSKAAVIKSDFAKKTAQPAAVEPVEETPVEQPTPVAETPAVEEAPVEPVEETPAEPVQDSATKMIQDLINSVSSIRDLPNLNSSTANTLTTKIISLMSDNPGIKASDVAAMIDVKRKEFLENLQTSDLKPGDIVTFADGKKGMVKKSSNEEVTIKMPKVKDALVLNQQDLSKRITMVEAGTVAKAKKEAPVEITESDKVEVEASKDAVDGFTSNAAKVQELNKDILANTGKDNSANVNNLIDKLGCKTNAKK